MKNVLIVGAGIAGPALAYWLSRAGMVCTVVERAPALRRGGQAVDFRGPIHRAVLDRMDLWGAIEARRTLPGDLEILTDAATVAATLPAVMTAGDVEILRGDLCDLLYERTQATTAYRFSESITAIDDGEDGVRVTFASGARERFDFVVGADGLHSSVRALAIADEPRVLRHHGYRLATFATENLAGLSRGSRLYSQPGRGVLIGATGRGDARALFIHAAAPLGADRRDEASQKSSLRAAFSDLAWEVPRLLEALDHAPDLYVDSIATVHVDQYARGRVVLIGDAAWGGTLGGQGTSLAIVGAYVLAGEIGTGGDLEAAFARYEKRMRRYATRCQKGAVNAGMFFAPKTRLGLRARNFMYWLLTTRPLVGFFEWLVKDAATDMQLPTYAMLA